VVREAKLEQEGEARFRELFENMSSGVAIYAATDDGNDFIITDFNWAGELIERMRKEEVIGNRLTVSFPEASNAGLLDVVQRVWSTSNPEYSLISVTTAEGDIQWRENHVFKLPAGEIVNVYDDVTDSKRTE
jgi:PAS domain S-box-containing protein